MNPPLLVSKDRLFGLEETVEDFQSKTIGSASNDNSAHIVGIVGMGGSGKTTLAKEAYNVYKRKYAFIHSSFLYDVRDEASKEQLPKLQKKLLKDLGVKEDADKGKYLSFENVHEGMNIIAHRLRSVSMLVVVDDVDHTDQIDALVPPENSLGPHSLIIITTRNLDVLTSVGIAPSSIYKMEGLDPSYVRGLFCLHAFRGCDPPQEFEDLVKEALSTCQRLPLSLKVLGGQLCHKPREYWESQLNEFSRVLPPNIKNILKKSYDALDPEDQELFLDIACFFIGERKSLVIEVWDGLGQSGVYRLETLKDKCLVEVDQKNCIRMHDHLRDLGREIAKGKSPCRIWLQGQINNSSQQAKEEMQIRGILAATTGFFDNAGSRWSNCCPVAHGFCSSHYGPFEECVDVMQSSSLPLKLLVLKDEFFSKKIGELLKGLVWLRWFDFDRACLPSYLSVGNLRVLELYEVQRIGTLWENPPLQLRELVIQMVHSPDDKGSFQCFPKSIGTLKHLKKLVLHGRNEFSFRSLPDEFCDLESLEHLELQGFEMLSPLPSRFGNLINLRHVTLEGLSSLSCLPVSFKQLTCLQYLDLSSCIKLNFTAQNLDILENITKLEYLSFACCLRLKALPLHITNQPFLRALDCSGTSIRNVPPNICDLSSLTTLEISGCSSLECLPPSFGNLSCLTTLEISDCSSLKCLPLSFGNLSSLTTLQIISCRRLESLPDSLGCLNRLEELYMSSVRVKSLPDTFRQLANLRKLNIGNCPLRQLTFRSGSASSLWSLKEIFLHKTSVATISISEDCRSLETLDIHGSGKLLAIETLPRTLKHLTVNGCPRLKELPSFAYFTSLKDLEIDGPNKLEKIENLEQLTSLETLRVTRSGSKVPRLAGIEQIQRRLRTVELSADNISALEPCLQTIKRWPCEMVIWGSAVDGAKSIVSNFNFPQLTVVHSVADKVTLLNDEWSLNCRETYSSKPAIICILFHCLCAYCEFEIYSGRGQRDKVCSKLKMTKGKWVWIGAFDSSTVNDYSLPAGIGTYVKIENEMIAVGEERRVQEVLKELTLLLQG